jgi:serine/threonine-protein kinase
MEYVPGGTLRARLRQVAPSGGAGADEIVATARSLLEALAYVHARSIAHGDLKPSNLLLRRPGSVVVADFGIAQLIGGEVGGEVSGDLGSPAVAAHRATDAPAGTPLYLAPEQFAGAPASPATDLYAAGAILWEMLMGRPLRDQSALVAGSLHDAPPVSAAAVARLDATGAGAELAALTTALTRRLPSERVASATDALARLSSTSPPAAAPPSSRS